MIRWRNVSGPVIAARRASLALFCLLATAPVLARDLRPGIIGADDRVRAGRQDAAWSAAVGQVNIGGYRTSGQCTGTLVAPDLVVTAAHCLMDPVKRAPRPLKDIHFLAGVDGPSNKGHAKARCLRFPEGHAFVPPSRAGGVPLAALLQDAAVIVLDRPVDVAPIPMAGGTDVPPIETAFTHAAYPADRRFALTLHKGCRRLPPVGEAPLWSTDCDTHPASSGGPLLTETADGPRIIAVMVGVGRGRSLALPSSKWEMLTRAADCPK